MDRSINKKSFGLSDDERNAADSFFERNGEALKKVSLIDSEDNAFLNSGAQSFPTQKYRPSHKLAGLIKDNVMVDELEKQLLKQVAMVDFIGAVSEEMESFFTCLAKRTPAGETTSITQERRFTPEIYAEITERLQLDSQHAAPIVEGICEELIFFASHWRVRKWGEFSFKNNEIIFTVKKDAFKIPTL